MQLFTQKKFMRLAFFVLLCSMFFDNFCGLPPRAAIEGRKEKFFLGRAALLGLGVSLCAGCNPVEAVRGAVTAGMATELALRGCERFRVLERVVAWSLSEAFSRPY